jgi:hypothetical protein
MYIFVFIRFISYGVYFLLMRKVIIVVIPLLLLFTAFIGIGIYLHSIYTPPIKINPNTPLYYHGKALPVDYAVPEMPATPPKTPSSPPLSTYAFLWPYFLAIGIIGLLSTLIFVFRKAISKIVTIKRIKDFIWFLID